MFAFYWPTDQNVPVSALLFINHNIILPKNFIAAWCLRLISMISMFQFKKEYFPYLFVYPKIIHFQVENGEQILLKWTQI